MLKEAHTENEWLLPEESRAILPYMTALFVDSLGPRRNKSNYGAEWFRKAFSSNNAARIFRLPLGTEKTASFIPEAISGQNRSVQKQGRSNPASAALHARDMILRTLIRGISHHFNNLLMGIWGNATLIRMRLNEQEPLYIRVAQMERLIQSGAFLIHMVLGYLGERRTLAKQIRLNQLIAEIKNEIPGYSDQRDPWNFEARLKWASRVQRPRMIAGSAARVLEVLFHGIQAHCTDIVAATANDSDFQEKLDTMGTLVMRGLDMIRQLRLYAGDFEFRPRSIRLAPLVHRLIKQLNGRKANIRVSYDISPKLPLVRAERSRLEWVLQQLLSNAVAAMPGTGTLAITVCTLQQEAPEDRYGIQKGSDYVVMTVTDSGCGMSAKIQNRIFEPFFASPQKHGRKGLGLAAADGVLKTHNGYIQVRSTPKAGSTFKIYLPIAGTAVQGQKFKEHNGGTLAA